MSGAVQGLAPQVDQLHQGLPEEMVRSFQWPPLLLQVVSAGGTRRREGEGGEFVVRWGELETFVTSYAQTSAVARVV